MELVSLKANMWSCRHWIKHWFLFVLSSLCVRWGYPIFLPILVSIRAKVLQQGHYLLPCLKKTQKNPKIAKGPSMLSYCPNMNNGSGTSPFLSLSFPFHDDLKAFLSSCLSSAINHVFIASLPHWGANNRTRQIKL